MEEQREDHRGLGVGSGDPSGENIFAQEEEEREEHSSHSAGLGVGSGDPSGENVFAQEEEG